MSHNKKRNTAFLYEAIVRELTKAIVVEKDEQKQNSIKVSNRMRDELQYGPQALLDFSFSIIVPVAACALRRFISYRVNCCF